MVKKVQKHLRDFIFLETVLRLVGTVAYFKTSRAESVFDQSFSKIIKDVSLGPPAKGYCIPFSYKWGYSCCCFWSLTYNNKWTNTLSIINV